MSVGSVAISSRDAEGLYEMVLRTFEKYRLAISPEKPGRHEQADEYNQPAQDRLRHLPG
jgi:hypothetical protein